MRIQHAEKTDVGMRRENNEDNYLVLPEQNLFAVFDGMGGYAAGEVASAIAANEVKEFFRLTAADEEATWPFKAERDRSYDENRLLTGVKLANARNGVGAKALVAHVGDSRVYLFRDGALQRITADHSLVEEYLRLGKLSEEQAKNFPQKNIILRALGQQKVVDVDLRAIEPRAGDVFLLCSDGLSGMIADEVMQSILATTPALDAAVKKLVDAANAAGGTDNVTVVLARYQPG